MISAVSTLLLSLALPISSEAAVPDSLPWDTAYIDAQTYIDNLADTIQGAGRQFAGPGPILVHFEAAIDEEVMTYFAWEFAADQQFSSMVATLRELNVDYTFDEAGTYYARFTTSNADNSEETFSIEPYVIQVTESLLDIPNLITPDSPSGANQVFKVKYKSLTSFEMWVFNRWGKQLFHTKDPSQGWDGTIDGKTAPTGAYYYMIKARGTDGIEYNKKGDINVLRTKNTSTSGI